jgi:hypothetical protein
LFIAERTAPLLSKAVQHQKPPISRIAKGFNSCFDIARRIKKRQGNRRAVTYGM